MGELKRVFSSAVMNKDMDERVVPNGSYREATMQKQQRLKVLKQELFKRYQVILKKIKYITQLIPLVALHQELTQLIYQARIIKAMLLLLQQTLLKIKYITSQLLESFLILSHYKVLNLIQVKRQHRWLQIMQLKTIYQNMIL